ncbi:MULTISPECIES: HupE/UreJ family protein [unclassified Yoonia]|uniref:HupE/UreJ family protein n=1 Tax=unclassified Yoonia TaxID=2629118 RepID=UPI002B0022AF|nr:MULTISPECIES: HupE/UreJ family protein [unclassified Yoonia]
MIVSLPKLPVWISAALLWPVTPLIAQEPVNDTAIVENTDLSDAPVTAWGSVLQMLPQGFENILPGGPVHILFVLALLFLSRRSGPLIWQLGLFALGYISALTLGAYGIISISPQVVFPLMAVSVVILAIDNIFGKVFGMRRVILVFGLALIHGFGLANGFDASVPAILPALVGYIIGIEMALLLVAAIVGISIWEAIRVDQGVNEVLQSYAIYGVLAAAALALIALNPPFLVAILHQPIWVFAAPLTALFALCALSVTMRDRIDAYHHIVAVPVSAAMIGLCLYWWLAPILL